ncbi:MAG TPA: response regulator [Methanospirillum sp.]|nr:response regulator [Methanospirillum sp.]
MVSRFGSSRRNINHCIDEITHLMISVLFVDDEPVLVDIGRMFLERAGDFSVTGVLSGREAVTLLKENAYDVIISDYQMPGMNGIELLRFVREQCGDIPFILFTGRGDEAVAGDAVNRGVDFYVQKGGDPKLQFADIAHKIETAVERRRALLAIKASEERFHDIINFLPDATFAINTEGIIIAWNREIERITGTRAQDMIGRGAYAHAVPFYGSRRPMIADLLLHPDPATEQVYPSLHREESIITAEGVLYIHEKRHYFLARASFLYQHGIITGAIESLRDITRQKESEEKLMRIINHLPLGLQIFRIEKDGRLICSGGNPAAEEMGGVGGRCAPGRSLEEVFPDDDGKIAAICRKIAMEGGRDCMDNVGLPVDGSIKRYNIRMFQIDPGEVALLYV